MSNLVWKEREISNCLDLHTGQDSDGEESEPDLFQCGKCKQMFTSLQKYLKHKAAKDCVQLKENRTVISPVTNGEVRSREEWNEKEKLAIVQDCCGTDIVPKALLKRI